MSDTHLAKASQNLSKIEENQVLEKGTYEIIQNRLQEQKQQLKKRLDHLNEARKKVFGAIETQLIANDRINTANYCIARDIIALGNYCLFGYNVHIGLRSGIQLQDVFSVYLFQESRFIEQDLHLIDTDKFQTDFQNLYRYYKDAFFARFVQKNAYMYMVFQISKNPGDYKAFKWLIKEGQLIYIDARSEQEIKTPRQHEFKWKRAHREMQRNGAHPHISIMDRVFVETVGGDLTIKIEDNTDDGLGIYREEVEYKDQTLDDAEYFYADLGNLIALKIRPYQEDFRYFIYNEKIQQAQRMDSLKDSGVLLPDGHGLIFANGYYLQTGDYKIFDPDLRNKQYLHKVISPNGEDYIFAFYNPQSGTYVLLQYNLIAQKVNTPIICHGYTIFPGGELCYFRTEDDPTKHHLLQIWQTPFVAGEQVPSEHTDNYLYKVGNKDLVKAMAECQEIITLIGKDDSYANLYGDLSKKSTEVLDSYYWIDEKEAFRLNEPLSEIQRIAVLAIEEYEKKIGIQKTTQEAIGKTHASVLDIIQKVKRQNLDSITLFVNLLTDLRTARGEIITLKELRYANLELIEDLEHQVIQATQNLSQDCVQFLLADHALTPYQDRIADKKEALPNIQTAKAGADLSKDVDQIGNDLQLLIEVVSNLKIEDATQTTKIIDNISNMYTGLNQLKASIKKQQKKLVGNEAIASFHAQLNLLDQGIINYLDLADTVSKCDDFLTKLMVQVEELESKFVDFEEFLDKITEKREKIYNAFETRKKDLLEVLHNRTLVLQKAGERILASIENRVNVFQSNQEIHSFFAADLMVEKVRDIIQQLLDLEDSNKASLLQTKLKRLKELASQQLKDKKDLFVQGENIIQFGKHHFNVNKQPLELTIVKKEDKLFYHLSGTDFFEEITDDSLLSTKEIWSQNLISENPNVYRGEYLAYQMHENGFDTKEAVQKQASLRYQEGYQKGIHDEDAFQILKAIYELQANIDLLKYTPEERALAQLIWERHLDSDTKDQLLQQIKSAGLVLEVFPNSKEFDYLIKKIKEAFSTCLQER